MERESAARPRVAVLGAGAMGEIFAAGLLRAGWHQSDLILAVRREERARDLHHATGIETTLKLADAIPDRDVLVVSVKPKDVPVVIDEVGSLVDPEQTLLSIAAGVPISLFEEAMPGVPVVRAMPNTPSAVDRGMSAYTVGASVDETHRELAKQVLSAVGETIELSEDLLDAVTAVSGTGPAYVFLLAESLIEAAIREGLPHHAAERLVHETLRGSGELLATSDKSAFRLRGEVTSPGGTTAAAMHVLEEGGFRALIEDAVQAAAHRSRDLGERASGQ
ncbi:MAG: pyrroline-5-carboxylate reductase [Acidimicrobiia bacterium]|nr:pyrroline-5-carboxylate reductase [Acidimicrobiia bacterium]